MLVFGVKRSLGGVGGRMGNKGTSTTVGSAVPPFVQSDVSQGDTLELPAKLFAFSVSSFQSTCKGVCHIHAEDACEESPCVTCS